jgi:hypothetical protein
MGNFLDRELLGGLKNESRRYLTFVLLVGNGTPGYLRQALEFPGLFDHKGKI